MFLSLAGLDQRVLRRRDLPVRVVGGAGRDQGLAREAQYTRRPWDQRGSRSRLDDHEISVVVPVYRGEHTSPALVDEIAPHTKSSSPPDGHAARVAEVVLVHDCGPDDSDRVIRELAAAHDWVRPVWLSRNFGQHAATLAGMASSGGDWIVTMDEDGQHDPADIGAMLDTALAEQATVVYARPTNAAAARRRSATCRRAVAKRLIEPILAGGTDAATFHSFRLVLGEVGRSVAAYAGAGVYLDVALGWVAGDVATCPVELRDEGEPAVRLLACAACSSHFWRMVLTSGTRLLRLVSVLGALMALVGLGVALVLIGLASSGCRHSAAAGLDLD